LRQNRFRDRAAGRTLAGPQASDLVVRHGPKDVPVAHHEVGGLGAGQRPAGGAVAKAVLAQGGAVPVPC
jgi:DNA replication and repair protein RecF